MILEVHMKLNHACSNSKNKECINEHLGYYGVPNTVVQCFVETCLVVSFLPLNYGIVALLFSNAISDFFQFVANIVATKT